MHSPALAMPYAHNHRPTDDPTSHTDDSAAPELATAADFKRWGLTLAGVFALIVVLLGLVEFLGWMSGR